MERILQLQKQEATHDFDSYQLQCNFRKSKCNTYKQQYGIAAIRFLLNLMEQHMFFKDSSRVKIMDNLGFKE
ncbi:hypothetical protein DV515_00000483 [Chloebia gouldiae]|uniref:Uncharacterized protein n=1 Tax=Chloebia gouldiae TaxID=44316 RepID=A0A3L8T1S6_CHLGU|nr:hypothetical protein DV515_00000483 [Chloebia gouldiae]